MSITGATAGCQELSPTISVSADLGWPLTASVSGPPGPPRTRRSGRSCGILDRRSLNHSFRSPAGSGRLAAGSRPARSAAQRKPVPPKSASVARTKLRPANAAGEPSRPESIGAQNLIDEHSQWPVELVKCVMKRDDRPFDKERREEVEIQFHATIGVIPVDPQKSQRSIPRAT